MIIRRFFTYWVQYRVQAWRRFSSLKIQRLYASDFFESHVLRQKRLLKHTAVFIIIFRRRPSQKTDQEEKWDPEYMIAIFIMTLLK